MSGSQHSSSSNCPPFDLAPLCLYVRILVFYDGGFFSFVSCTPIFSLVGPVWAFCSAVPSLPFLCAPSTSCTFPSSSPSSPSLTWFLPVTSCLTCLFVGFSPCFFPLPSLLWPAWAYCPARHFSLFYALTSPLPLLSSLLSSLLSPLSTLLHLSPSSKGVCPKRLCPTWQHLVTFWPKVVLRCHVVSLFALALPMIFSRLFYVPPMLPVPPMPLDAWVTGYFTTSSLGTLLTTECRACYTNDLCFQSPLFSFFVVWK